MRDTISKYGWIIITIIIIAIILGFSATIIHFVKQASYDYVGGITGAIPDGMQKEGRNGSNDGDSEDIAYAIVLKNPTFEQTSQSNNDYQVIPLGLVQPEPMYLVFTRSKAPYEVGDIYNSETFGSGLVVEAVYTGFETVEYEFDMEGGGTNVPWIEYGYNIVGVATEDVIQPISTASWFLSFYFCETLELSKLDTSKTTNMMATFALTGLHVDDVSITGLERWDTSKVINMSYMFATTGSESLTVTISNIENWNTSSVKYMDYMFAEAALWVDNFSLNLSKWNVDNVISHIDFTLDAAPGIIAPNWKN